MMRDMEFDVEVIVSVKGRQSAVEMRRVCIPVKAVISGDVEPHHFDAATMEAAVRSLEDAGPAARRIVGQLPFTSDITVRNTPLVHSMMEPDGSD